MEGVDREDGGGQNNRWRLHFQGPNQRAHNARDQNGHVRGNHRRPQQYRVNEQHNERRAEVNLLGIVEHQNANHRNAPPNNDNQRHRRPHRGAARDDNWRAQMNVEGNRDRPNENQNVANFHNHWTNSNNNGARPKRQMGNRNALRHQGGRNHLDYGRNIKGHTSSKDEEGEISDNEIDSVTESVGTLSVKNVRNMGFSKLKDMTHKMTCNEVLLAIYNKDNGFLLTIQENYISTEKMAYILIILGRITSSYMREIMNGVINDIANLPNFFLLHVQQYLGSFQMAIEFQELHLKSLIGLTDYLEKYQQVTPSNASGILCIILPLLDITLKNKLSNDESSYAEISEKLQAITDANKQFVAKYTPQEIKIVSLKEKLQNLIPPESYRSIPVLPSIEDIHQPCTFLRPNIIKGEYKNTEDYLDVQYRLLREDYVIPLRDGIQEYLKLKKRGKSLKRSKEIRMYSDVHIVKQDFVPAGLVHLADFNDKQFSKIKWEYSKRFLTGSLLCLSSDNFKTVLFATVAKRDPKELSKGLLYLRFEELTDETLNISPLQSFDIVETTAYFEAYRHNLSALIELNEDNLPMKEYIVHVQKNIKKPQYLTEMTTYDMRPLLVPIDQQHIKEVKQRNGNVSIQYEYPDNVDKRAGEITVMNDNGWPTHTELNLNPTQYSALKAAITSEFAIIQGPPGTGKTYVGLRIAQLLLRNKEKWQSRDHSSPILVVCFTNHALDQFLEGMLPFTKNLVRIGGKSSNQALEKYQLNQLKRRVQEKRSIPHIVFSSIRVKNQECRDLKRDIGIIRGTIDRAHTTVISENILNESIPKFQYESLKSIGRDLKDDGRLILDWLEVRVRSNDHVSGNLGMNQEGIPNIWNLHISYRWNLYYTWLHSYAYVKEKEIFEMKIELKKRLEEFDRLKKKRTKGPAFYQLKDAKEQLSHELSKQEQILYQATMNVIVLSENTLRPHMSLNYFLSLKRLGTHLQDDGYIIHDWLQFRYRHGIEYAAVELSRFPQLVEDNHDAKEAIMVQNIPIVDDVESEGEADIDYIEAQRDVNPDGYTGLSYNVNANDNAPISYDDIDSDGGWKTQGGVKKHKKYISSCLRSSDAMSEEEVARIVDVWALQMPDRWRLYKFWLQNFIIEKQEESLKLQQQLRQEYTELCEMRTEEDLFVCRHADVVGLTTTGAAKYRGIVHHLNPKILIVEEAAEVLESHIVTSMSRGTQHVILIGDHQQLRPSPTVHMLSVKYDLNISLFERMVENGMSCHRLGIQHRMRPEIASLISPHIYTDLENHHSVMNLENIRGVNKNMFFVTHTFNENQENDSSSKVNVHETDFLVKLCKYLLLQGYDPSQITVLSAYSAQHFALKKKRSNEAILQGVRFTVLDNYQGEENDIILISFVRSNEAGEIGFLKIDNRVCVALSRAKKGLYCIGNFELLASKSELWKNIVGTLEADEAIGPSLILCCQNHPDTDTAVSTGKDFDSVKEGGCSKSCEYRLECGHVCSKLCHSYDQAHTEIQCPKPCTKKCSEGHECNRKCSQVCGPCGTMVDKMLPSCKHVVSMPCYQLPERVPCPESCNKILPCGHQCTKKCSELCSVKCMQMVKVISEFCGHTVSRPCYNTDNRIVLKNCKEPCKATLSCDHVCKGTCSKCYQGRLHVSCNQPCKQILVCGHECKASCSKGCPPCRLQCENRCVHSKCPKKCGEPCDECREPCIWSCKHKKCTKLCFEACDREPCNDPCGKLLECKHPCIGLCGEPCPKSCRICNESVKDIFFGSEDEPDARFVLLEDCDHIIEADGMLQWMDQVADSKQEIQMKSCPKCKTVIRKNLRFGSTVKKCLEGIDKVKRQSFGNQKRNKELQKNVLHKLKNSEFFDELLFIHSILEKMLASKKTRSLQELITVENIIDLSAKFSTVLIHLNTKAGEFASHGFILDTVKQLSAYVMEMSQMFVKFIKDEYLTASEHQLEQLNTEVQRLKLIDNLMDQLLKADKSKQKLDSKALDYVSIMMKSLASYCPLQDEAVKTFTKTLKEFSMLMTGTALNITEMERKDILKAMNLSRGHWYECPNGHVYCIADCGGAMVESFCNECGAKIGGTSHRLLSTNRVATAMDGARHGAWSDAMNMGNYNLNDL